MKNSGMKRALKFMFIIVSSVIFILNQTGLEAVTFGVAIVDGTRTATSLTFSLGSSKDLMMCGSALARP